MNADSIVLIKDGRSNLNFTHELKGCWTAYPDNPEAGLAFDETAIRSLYQAGPMKIEGVNYGGWCGRACATG